MDLIARRADGSFVAIVDGYPYHVTEGDPLYAEALKKGATIPLEREPAPQPLTADDACREVMRRVDAVANARGYDSGVSCASYVASSNPTWAAEAAAFIAWRDAVWVCALAEIAKLKGGRTIKSILPKLPAIEWPA